MNTIDSLPDYAAPCGIYCKACPALGKSCSGCRSEKAQKRTSKYACHMRCCTAEKGIGFCSECDQVPCKIYKSRFLTQHRTDVRYQYRRDAFTDLQLLKTEGFEVWDTYQQKKWSCPDCGSVVWIYAYECSACQKKWLPY
jgi:hypothetical protein